MISSNVVLTSEHLDVVVRHFMRQPGLSFDVESVGIHRGIPALNTVTWLSMSTFGMTVAIPCGHPIGSRVIGTAKEPRKDKNGRIRQFSVPVYEEPPPQLTPEQVFDSIRPLFFREDILKIAHEATFDLGSTAKYWGEIAPGPYGDTKVLMRLLDENTASQNNGLKAWVKRFYGVDYDKENVGKKVEAHPFNKVAHYSYMDALYTWLIWQANIPRVRKEKLEVVHDEVERPLIGPLTSMRLAGVNMDVPRLESTRDELSARLVGEEAAVYRAAGRKFNLNSPPQKQEVLFGAAEEGGQGLKPWKMTDHGAASTDADVLKSYPNNQLCQALIAYSDTHKLLSTYLNSWLGVEGDAKKPSLIIDGILYTEFQQHGTVTSRFSGRSPNLQNIPRPDKPDGKLIRGAFSAPVRHKLVVADYGQIELVILASLIGRGKLFDGFLAGIDPHLMHAAGVLRRKPVLDVIGGVTKDERQRFGKTLGFCVPMDSEALTRTGWKHYDDLTTHDEVLGYENGVLRWTPVEAKYKFADQPVVEMSTGGWKSRSTPHHRWVCDRRTGRGTTRRYVDEFRTTENINTECRIKLSALVDAEGEPSISVRDAAIIGWVVTDGCVQRADDTGRTSQGVGSWKRSLSVSIYQSATANPDKVKIIDALLVDVPHSRYENPSRAGSIQWLLRPQFARDLWSRTGMGTQDSLSDFVLKLTTQARGAFLEACWLGDGGVDPYGVKLLYQNEGEVLDAMQLAAYMEGYDVPRYLAASKGSLRQFPDGSSRISTADHYSLRLRKPLVTGQQMKRVDVGTADVWCVQTPLKSWVMRQNNRIMLTGNTIVNGAGWKTVAEVGGFSEKQAKNIIRDYGKEFPEVDEFRNAMIRMAKSRPGTPYVRGILGRKRRLPGLHSSDNGLRMYNERQLFNYLIQNGAAELMKLALIRADYMLAEQVPDAFLTMTVHDELVAVAPDESAEECRSIIVEAMTGPEMQKLIKVPLRVDAHVVDRWSEAK